MRQATLKRSPCGCPVRTPKKSTDGWAASPRLREWIGDRVIRNLSVHDWRIKNRKFESTIAVPRDALEDDTYGVFGPMISEMGREARDHPNELVFRLLANGFSTACYDGQYFFDTDHLGTNAQGEEVSVSKHAGGQWSCLVSFSI